MKRYLRLAAVIFVCVIMLLAIIIITTCYLRGLPEEQIDNDLKKIGRGIEIKYLEKINHSIVAIIEDDNTVQCIIYDRYPFSTHYNKNSVIEIDEESYSALLSNGWDRYILGISKSGITIENIEQWKGNWTERLVEFLISAASAIIVVIVIVAVKKRS